jgi:Flp pilus assembly protein TadD
VGPVTATLLLTLVQSGGQADPSIVWQIHAAALRRSSHAPPAEEVARVLGAAAEALRARAYARAQALAAETLLSDPTRTDGWLTLGLALFRDGRPADAAQAFEAAAVLEPQNATIRFDLGSARFESGRPEEAETAYLRAAELDRELSALSLYDAALSSEAAHEDRRALAHLHDARDAAVRLHQPDLEQRAVAKEEEIAARLLAEVWGRLRGLVQAGRAALKAKRPGLAEERYAEALALASLAGLRDADRAELEFALGHARLRAGRLPDAIRAFARATALLPREAQFHFILGVAHSRHGEDDAAEHELDEALRLGLARADAQEARDLLRVLRQRRRDTRAKLTLDVRVGTGYDSNVPQSGVVLAAQGATGALDSGAAQLLADLALSWRMVGDMDRGLRLEYRFGQLAYLSDALDPYSIQEHDLTLSGAIRPHRRLSLEAFADGFALFSGVKTFTPFQAGLSIGPRLTIREGRGFETVTRYQHVFKWSLDPTYAYLGGNRDEVALTEVFRATHGRLSLAYQFTHEAVGTDAVLVSALYFPLGAPAVGPDATYHIPYSRNSHEVSLVGALDLPLGLRGLLTLRYEHSDYLGQSFIDLPATGQNQYLRQRVDNRYVVDAALRRTLWGPFDAELAYTLVINRSTIDNTVAQTARDYDNKDYYKHVATLELSYAY